MRKFDIYLKDRLTKFDIGLGDRLTKSNILIYSLAFHDSFSAATHLLLDARMLAPLESNNLVTEHGDPIMIGNVKILV